MVDNVVRNYILQNAKIGSMVYLVDYYNKKVIPVVVIGVADFIDKARSYIAIKYDHNNNEETSNIYWELFGGTLFLTAGEAYKKLESIAENDKHCSVFHSHAIENVVIGPRQSGRTTFIINEAKKYKKPLIVVPTEERLNDIANVLRENSVWNVLFTTMDRFITRCMCNGLNDFSCDAVLFDDADTCLASLTNGTPIAAITLLGSAEEEC